MNKTRRLGKNGLEVSTLGLGCMGLTWAYGPTNELESIKVLKRALELGINFLDTAEVYGPYTNEDLIGRVIKSFSREKLILATKFGFKITSDNQIIGLDSNPIQIKKSIEGSLKRLNTDYIDLYYQHRLDPNVAIEDVMETLSSLVKEGKIRYIGLSEVGSNIIRKAHAIHPITAVQSEYSILERGAEKSVLPTLRELGIGFVAYSPLGRGFLAGTINDADELDAADWRRTDFPRIQAENIEHNLFLVKELEEISKRHQATPAQIAVAWLLKQGDDIVPIPGTKHIHYLEENLKSMDINLSESEWKSLDQFLLSFSPAGLRYLESNMKLIAID